VVERCKLLLIIDTSELKLFSSEKKALNSGILAISSLLLRWSNNLERPQRGYIQGILTDPLNVITLEMRGPVCLIFIKFVEACFEMAYLHSAVTSTFKSFGDIIKNIMELSKLKVHSLRSVYIWHWKKLLHQQKIPNYNYKIMLVFWPARSLKREVYV